MKLLLHFRYQLYCIVFCSLCCISNSSYSQPPHFIFKHLSVEDGLSQSTVHVIYQDRKGFMWFGTDIGLNKYDGYKFTVYQSNAQDSNAISSNFIVDILEDSYDGIWIANGYNGLDLFDREKEIFKKYRNDENNPGSISNNNIRAIFEDSHKNLWIGTSGGGINLFNRKTNSFEHFVHDSLDANSLGSNFVKSINEDKKGNLWIGSTEGVLCKFNPKNNTFTNFFLYGNYKGDLYNSTFCSVYIDSEDDIWFGTEIGLFNYNQKTNKIIQYEKNSSPNSLNVNAVSSVLELEKDIYMIATDHGGLNVLNRKTGEFYHYLNVRYDETTISNNQLYSIYKSPDGIIWIGSFHGGVNIYDKKAIKFQQYKYVSTQQEAINCCNSVLTICEDRDRNIWIGNDGQGIDIYNPKTKALQHMMPDPKNINTIRSNSITEIYKDRNDDIWIGTYLEGMSRYDWKTKRFTHYHHDPENTNSIGGNNIWTILEDKKNKYWIGTIGGGLDIFDPKTNIFSHFVNNPSDPYSLSNNDVFKVFEDKSGNIWIGTRNGLNLYNPEKKNFTHYIQSQNDSRSIIGSWIYDIIQDHNGNLWVGTDLALNLFQPELNGFTPFSEKDGIKNNAVLSIIEDKMNNLWISTNKGISKFSIDKKTFRNYDIADGLQGTEFNYTCGFLSSDGRMYFGGKNGFNVFDPAKIIDNSLIPPVYITSLKISNELINPRTSSILSKHINFEKKIVLTYKQSTITFEFTALNYTNPKQNQYSYKLEGFDDDWTNAGNRHDVTYTNLNSGTYYFRVKGSNNDRIWNNNETTLEIRIKPPFWKTIWFFGLEGIILITGIYFYIVLREQKLKNDKLILQDGVRERTLQIELQKEELEQHRNHLEQLIEHRTEELIAAKEKAEESDRLKSAFLANMSHEIRTPMNAIVGFSSLLEAPDISTEERNEYISLINSNSESLLVIIEDILDLSLIEANQIIIRNQVFDINDLLDNIYSSFQVNNKKQSLTISLNNTIKDSFIKLDCDQFRTRQILSNLMNNAYKFTDSGIIELGAKLDQNQIIFYVKDSGIGMSKEDIPIIFNRFRKLEKGYSTAYRGAGLGLAISKRLAELMKGDIWAESNPGEGSIFYFSLPFNPNDLTTEPVPVQQKINGSFDWASKNFLIVEDEKTNYLFLQKALKKTNVNITWAENGILAVKLCSTKKVFDIILMDIKMPVMNGYEATEIIRRQRPNQIIIAQTAYARPEDEFSLRNAGFTDYISKPIKPEHLFTMINKHLGTEINPTPDLDTDQENS